MVLWSLGPRSSASAGFLVSPWFSGYLVLWSLGPLVALGAFEKVGILQHLWFLRCSEYCQLQHPELLKTKTANYNVTHTCSS